MGDGCKAGYKIHLVWEAISGSIQNLSITGSNVTDQSTAWNTLKLLQKDDLVIRDLGYFSTSIFSRINKQGAFFLSRFKQRVNVYTLEGEKIDNLPKYIDQKYPHSSVIELNVLIGSNEKSPVRLIAYRVPEKVMAQRLRKKKGIARTARRTLSKESKSYCKFTFLITNVPEDIWPAEILGIVYKLRWQIELVFKSWKSLANIDLIKGKSENRAHCFILGRLIAVLIITMFFSCIKRYVEGEWSRELSLHKFMLWVLQDQRFLLIACPLDFERELLRKINESILDLCKQRRSRATTQDALEIVADLNIVYIEDVYDSPLRKIA